MKTLSARKACFILFCLPLYFISCNAHSDSLTPNQMAAVGDSIQHLAKSIQADVSHDGPIAWLRYFSNSPEFYMASNGELVFPSIDSATTMTKNNISHMIHGIKLNWSNIRIDPLSLNVAGMAATFHEDITYADGKISPQDGYFSAIAEQTDKGWKLRNAHWSTKTVTPK